MLSKIADCRCMFVNKYIERSVNYAEHMLSHRQITTKYASYSTVEPFGM